MKRREFLGAAAALPLVGSLPGKTKQEPTGSPFPIGSYVVITGTGWKKEQYPGTWWLKGWNAVVIGYHCSEEWGEQVEVAVTKPKGDMILNVWFSPEELVLADRQRQKPVWEQV